MNSHLTVAVSAILALSLFASSAHGQGFCDQQVISTTASGVQSVFATDLDGDGDPDVLAASFTGDRIIWYENLGGGAFGLQKLITAQTNGALVVYAADLDGDGDSDVLSASYLDDTIAWYENLGGGTFGPQVRIASAVAHGAADVYATDLDGDGDLDVLSASILDDTVAWYENLGGGIFGSQQAITTLADGAVSVHATDLDGDGDEDVLSGSYKDDTVAWYENLGGGVFGPQQAITTLADVVWDVHAADLDGDGDMDVLSAQTSAGTITWYENLGGGVFGAQQVITTLTEGVMSVFAVDLDGDGDADVLSASNDDSKIALYENLGGGVFGPQEVLTTEAEGARSVYATDMDGDGDVDVLSASYFDHKVAWYENVQPIGVSYCGPAVVNSSGNSATITALGLTVAGENCVRLRGSGLAQNQFGFFLNSLTQSFTNPPGSQGNLCLGGGVGRYNSDILHSGGAGAISLRIDLTQTPTPGGNVAVQPGETWNFQAWFRDNNPGNTSNFTDGVTVTFL
jgi:FG-GAP-like repeat